jgi:hypothetical protein
MIQSEESFYASQKQVSVNILISKKFPSKVARAKGKW